MYYQFAWQTARTQNRPLANNFGLRYGWLNAAYGLLQVVVSCSTASAYYAGLVTLLHSNDPGAGVVPLETIYPPALVAVISCLVGGVISVAISYYAARNTARLTRDVGLGQRAGMIAALVGAGSWAVLGALGAIITHTDGAFLAVDPFSSASVGSQLLGIVILVIGRALILGGISVLFAFFAATLGAHAGNNRPA